MQTPYVPLNEHPTMLHFASSWSMTMKSDRRRAIQALLPLCILAITNACSLQAQQISVSPGIITTIAGVPGSTTRGSAGDCSGAATNCCLYLAAGDLAQKVVIDSAGNLYFAGRYFNVVRKLTPMSAPGARSNLYGAGTAYTITTVAGNATQSLCPGTANAAAGTRRHSMVTGALLPWPL